MEISKQLQDQAKAFCSAPNQFGMSRSLSGRISGSFDMSRVGRWLINPQLSANIERNLLSYSGVLQDQLAAALSDSNNCKLKAYAAFSKFLNVQASDGRKSSLSIKKRIHLPYAGQKNFDVSSSERVGISDTDFPNHSLQVQCFDSARPSWSRDDKPLNIVEIVSPPPVGAFGGVGNVFMPPGIENIKSGNDFGGQYYKCIVNDYSNRPIFDIVLHLDVQWMAVEKTENGSKSGKLLANGNFSPAYIDVDVKPNNREFFYIWSNSPTYVNVRVSPNFEAKDNSDSIFKGKLISTITSDTIIWFVPHESEAMKPN